MPVRELTWSVYGMFYEAPGTPKDLKCVSCKVASGSATLAMAGASLYGMARTIRTKFYVGAGFGAAAFCFSATSAVLFRVAYDYRGYNESLIRNNAVAIKDERKKNREINKGAQTHEGNQTS